MTQRLPNGLSVSECTVVGSKWVAVLVHGGGWISGDKSVMTKLARYMQDHKVSTVTPEYRLVGIDRTTATTFTVCLAILLTSYISVRRKPIDLVMCFTLLVATVLLANSTSSSEPNHCMSDIGVAVQWTREKFPDCRIILVGHSAGAHLCTLYTAMNSASVDAVVGISGVYTDRYLMRSLLGSVYNQNLGHQYPIYHITRHMPPVLLITAKYDLGFRKDAREYATLLSYAGIDAQHITRSTHHLSITSDHQVGTDIAMWISQL